MEILGQLLQGYTPILLFILICFAALLVMFYKVVRSLDDVARTVTQDRESLHESVRQISDMLVMLARKQVEVGNALQKLGASDVTSPVSSPEQPVKHEETEKHDDLDAALAMAAGTVLHEAAQDMAAPAAPPQESQPAPHDSEKEAEDEYLAELFNAPRDDESDHIASDLSLGHVIEDEDDYDMTMTAESLQVAPESEESVLEVPEDEADFTLDGPSGVAEDAPDFMEPSTEDIDEALITPPEEDDEIALIEPPEDDDEIVVAAPVEEPAGDDLFLEGPEISEESPEVEQSGDTLAGDDDAVVFTLAEEEEPAATEREWVGEEDLGGMDLPEPGMPEQEPPAPEESAVHLGAFDRESEDDAAIDFSLEATDSESGPLLTETEQEVAEVEESEAEEAEPGDSEPGDSEEDVMLLDEPLHASALDGAVSDSMDVDLDLDATEPDAGFAAAFVPEPEADLEEEPVQEPGMATLEVPDEEESIQFDQTMDEDLDIIVESKQEVAEDDLLEDPHSADFSLETPDAPVAPPEMLHEEQETRVTFEEAVEFNLTDEDETDAAAAPEEEGEYDLDMAEEDMFSDSLGIVPEMYEEDSTDAFSETFDADTVAAAPFAETTDDADDLEIPGIEVDEDEAIVFDTAAPEDDLPVAAEEDMATGPTTLDLGMAGDLEEELEDADAMVDFEMAAPPEEARSQPMEAFNGMDADALDAMNQDVDVDFDEDEEEIDLDADLHESGDSSDFNLFGDEAQGEDITPEDEADISLGAALAEEDEFTLSDDEPTEQHVDITDADAQDQHLDVLIEDLMDVEEDHAQPDDDLPVFDTEIVLDEEEDDEPETILDLSSQRPMRQAPPSVISMDEDEDEDEGELNFSLAEDDDEDIPDIPDIPNVAGGMTDKLEAEDGEEELSFSQVDEEEEAVLNFNAPDLEDMESLQEVDDADDGGDADQELSLSFEDDDFAIIPEEDTGDDLDQTMPDLSPMMGGGARNLGGGGEDLDLTDLDIVIEPGGDMDAPEADQGDAPRDVLAAALEFEDEDAPAQRRMPRKDAGATPRKPPQDDDFDIDFVLDDEDDH